MLRKTITLGALLTVVSGISGLHAASTSAVTAPQSRATLNTAQVPADAKWLIYLNFDQAMRNPEAGKMLSEFLHTHPQAQKHVSNLEKAMGVKFPQGFHDVLLIGRNIGSNHGVVVIHANARQSRIKEFLRAQKADIHVTTPTNGINKIIDKKGQPIYETAPTVGTFVVSRSEKSLRHELHVLAGKAAGMTAENPLLVGQRPGVIMYMADMNMAQLADRRGHGHGPAWMKSVTGAWLAVLVKKEKLDIRGRINLVDANTAAQMVQMAQGWQAMMDLGATSANVEPRQRFMAGIADRLNVGAIGKVIRIHWAMSLAKLLAGPQKRVSATK